MNPTKKHPQPDSALNEDPSSGDGALNEDPSSGDGALNEDPSSGDGALNEDPSSGDGALNEDTSSGDGALNEDPSSGDGAVPVPVPNWRGRWFQNTRTRNCADMYTMLAFFNFHSVELAILLEKAQKVEGEFYNEATSYPDYLRMVNDYLKGIPDAPGALPAAGFLDISQAEDSLMDQIRIWLRSRGNTILPPLQQPQQQQPLTDSSIILPPQQQQQPLAGPPSGGNTIFLSQQQQQPGPNEHPMVTEQELRAELLALMENM